MRYYKIKFRNVYKNHQVEHPEAYIAYHNNPEDERVVRFDKPFVAPEIDIPYLLDFGDGFEIMEFYK